MRYFLDCEFDGFEGPLLSLALVREDNEALYLVLDREATDPWVRENVSPILWSIPSPLPGMAYKVEPGVVPHMIGQFLADDPDPVIISDWPDDIAYFCRGVITGPGYMIKVPGLKFEMRRVDAYPTKVRGAVQHNAYWDAQALRCLLMGLP